MPHDPNNLIHIISLTSRTYRPGNFIKANIKVEIKNTDNPGECYLLFNDPMNFLQGSCGGRNGRQISSLGKYKDFFGEVTVYEADKELARFENFDEFWNKITEGVISG